MGDHNWYSSREVGVATDGLRDAASSWHGFADSMVEVSNAANRLHLDVSAFAVIIDGPVSIGDAIALQAAYDGEFTKLNGLFKEAVTEFDAMGGALKENADWYVDVDANSAQSFDDIARGDWPH